MTCSRSRKRAVEAGKGYKAAQKANLDAALEEIRGAAMSVPSLVNNAVSVNVRTLTHSIDAKLIDDRWEAAITDLVAVEEARNDARKIALTTRIISIDPAVLAALVASVIAEQPRRTKLLARQAWLEVRKERGGRKPKDIAYLKPRRESP